MLVEAFVANGGDEDVALPCLNVRLLDAAIDDENHDAYCRD